MNGAAVGGGMEIALAADCIVAADTAIFGLPETKRGLIAAGGGAIRIGKRVPRGLALEMAMAGDPIDAQRALTAGMVNTVVPRGEVLAVAESLAQRIAAASPIAVRTTRQLVFDSMDCTETEGWDKSREASRIVLRSNDSKEGTKAFLEKRDPVWEPV